MNIEQMTYGEIVNEISPLSNNSAAHDVEFARRILAARDAQWNAAQQRVLAEQAEPVAWMHDTPGRVDVIHQDVKQLLLVQHAKGYGSPDHLHRPLGKVEHYTIPLFASPPAPQEAQADSTPLLPVARIRSWTKHGEGHGDLVDWLEGSENLPDGEYDLYLGPQSEQKPVASIYISPNGEREFDDWKHDLPIGRNELFAAPVAQPATEQAEAPRKLGTFEHRCPAVTGHRGGVFVCQSAGHGVSQNSYCKDCTCAAALATQPTASNAGERAPTDTLSFICTNGCGYCGVKLRDFVTHATQAQDSDTWVTVASEPEIVSTCCGHPVEVWDERKQDVVAEVRAALATQPTASPEQAEAPMNETLKTMIADMNGEIEG